jgi:hypothetical protein
MPPPGGKTSNDQSINLGANIVKRGSNRKSSLVSEKQFVSGISRIYMAIDDESRAQFIFDMYSLTRLTYNIDSMSVEREKFLRLKRGSSSITRSM